MKETVEQAAVLFAKPYPENDCVVVNAFVSGAEWQAKQSPWISVEERLPDNDERVLCQMKSNNAIVSGYIVSLSGGKPQVITDPDFEFFDLHDYEPDAWMPIPE